MNSLPSPFDFDRIVDRRDGPFPDSTKWNRYAGRDVLPLWVADMDFAAPPAVVDALHQRIDHGVFGYGEPWPSLVDAVCEYLESEYAWRIDPDWIVWLPGLVSGLNIACRAVGGDIFTATPIYPPFLSAPRLAGRRLLSAPLARSAAGWHWDMAMVNAALTPETGLFLLCHPHNPVGRAWTSAELQEIAELAERRDLVVCSDEIHCGLVLSPDSRHRPFAAVSAQAAQRSITLMAPSKTFNIPGLGCAFAVIPSPSLRRDFRLAMDGIVPHVNTLGLIACEAALRDGGAWHAALLDYLRGNAVRVQEAVAALPGLSMTPVEATYLAWIDCEAGAIAEPQRFFEAAGVGLSRGSDFGADDRYRHFVRLNFGCPRATLDAALARMARAVAGAPPAPSVR
jgi:cystathionine beta-lyase